MRSFWTLVILLAVAGNWACTKVKSFSNTPEIKVLDVYVADTGIVKATIQFTDGDGDIGLSDGDTVAPYDSATGFYNNLVVNYYESKNGVWVKDLSSGYRIQPITPVGKNKAIEGEIEVMLFYRTKKDVPPGQTYYNEIKYDFQLIDRGLNKSNVSESLGLTKQ